ncbi:MAG: hypothetical protein KAS32_11165, partial [Candidatus Peribacteraceae bacterium]|nr:hypothetical protein [Candidatus Peribacteraceae bacterium]
MSYSINNLKDAVAREMHGESVDSLQSFEETAYDAAMLFLSECDPKELQRETQISPQLFDNVTVYSCPADFQSVIDVLPTAGRAEGSEAYDDFRRTSQREMSLRHSIEAPMLSDKYVNGTRVLLLRKYPELGSTVQLEGFEATTDFTTGGDIGSLVRNSLTYWEGGASLSFALDGVTGEGTLSKTITSQDLTNQEGLASWFFKLYIPSGYSSRFTSLKINHGNSDSANFEKTITTQHDGSAFQDGMNLLRFDWSSATENGTVDITKMDDLKVTIVYATGDAIPGMLIDDFNVQLGTMYDLSYYSNYLFRTEAGVWIEKPTEDDDIINLSFDSYRVYADITAMVALSELS